MDVRQTCETIHFSIGAWTRAGKSSTPLCVASRRKRSASSRRSGEGAGKKTGRKFLRMLSTYAGCRAASTEAIWPVIVSKVTSCARAAARFFPENHWLESKVAQRSRPTELASEFSKRGAITEGGSESTSAELVCVWASERNRRPSQ